MTEAKKAEIPKPKIRIVKGAIEVVCPCDCAYVLASTAKESKADLNVEGEMLIIPAGKGMSKGHFCRTARAKQELSWPEINAKAFWEEMPKEQPVEVKP